MGLKVNTMGMGVKKATCWLVSVLLFVSCIFIWHGTIPGIYHIAKTRGNLFSDLGFFPSRKQEAEDLESSKNEPGRQLRELRKKINDRCDDEVIANVHLDDLVFHKPNSLKSDKFKLFYFPIPKVGCSFWKRVFKVINSGDESASIFDIPSFKAHTGRDIANMSVKSKDLIKRYASNYTSFVFVRDPFARLFSGYIDKMFVPNTLLGLHARYFFQRYRSATNGECGLNVSFSEFALYVAEAILGNRMRDGHFYPMWAHCNPCEMNVTYIGKMETFMEDTKYILSSVGIDINEVTGAQTDDGIDEKNDKGIIEDLAVRTFSYMKSKKNSTCISRKEVLQRIWTIYQIRGYLSKHQQMPHFKQPEKVTAKEFVDLAWKAYDYSGSKSEKSLQREESMMEAYSLVPRRILLKLAQAYAPDCRVYDYSCNIEKRFLSSRGESRERFYFKS